MGGTSKLAPAIALVLATAIFATGCGGGSSNAPESTGSTGSARTTAEPSDEFIVPGGDNSVQRFGNEASAPERKAASDALETYMRARAAEDWAKECAYLAKIQIESLQSFTARSQGKKKGCAATLEALSAGSGASAPTNTMKGPVGSLRVGEGRAFALYHGREGVDYVMQMIREGGEWKVAALAPFELS